MYQRFTVNVGGTLRTEELDGRTYKVVQSAILPHGVVKGNNGPCYYPAEENEASVPAWNHKPLIVNHPKDRKNKFISGCLPDVLRTRQVGIILNTSCDDKLRTECWFDEKKTNQVDQRILKRLEAGETIECSTGVYTENEEVEGEHEGEKYQFICRNYKPDHLAVLPDKLGAYPVKKGGGIGIQINEEPEQTREILSRTLTESLKSIGGLFANNELSFSEISTRLSDLLAAKLGEPGKYWDGYPCAIYSDRVVYNANGLWMMSYKVKDDEIALEGDPVKVERVQEYRTADGETYSANEAGVLTKKEIVVPKPKKNAFDKAAAVEELIANEHFEESDREWLESQDDDRIQKFQTKFAANAEDEGPDDDDEEVVEEKKAKKPAKLGLNELLEQVDPRTAESIRRGVQANEKERKKLIKSIMANENNQFNEKWLAKKDIEELEGLAALARPTVNSADEDDEDEPPMFGPRYRGQLNVDPELNANDDGGEEPLELPSFDPKPIFN